MLRTKTALVLAFHYLFLTRYSWLLAIVLVLIVPVSLGAMHKLLANLFVFDLPEQIYHVSWISMWCGVTVMETLRVTTLNAQLRFDDYHMAVGRFREAWAVKDEATDGNATASNWFTLLLGLFAAIVVWQMIMDACISRTAADPAPTWQTFLDASPGSTVTSLGWTMAIWGLLTTLVVIGTLTAVQYALLVRRARRKANDIAEDDQPEWQRSVYRFLHLVVGPGYFREEPSNNGPPTLHLAPGHVQLVLYTTTFVAWYVLNYVTATGDHPMPTEASPYPALFYGLLSLLLLLYLLPGFAFFWDRYRLPVPLLVLALVLLFYRTFDTDHYYELNPAPRYLTEYTAPSLTEVFDQWVFPIDHEGKRTMVVVDASGGGIQASAWTAQVLTGLHECYGNPFTQSVGLISSVSGGSVGTMFYLINRAEIDVSVRSSQFPPESLSPEAIAHIRANARSSALEATAWGIAYPDTMRTIFPVAVDKTVDRGWAIEQVWRQHMVSADEQPFDLSDLRLSDLGHATLHNQLPVAVFNATLMESGQRLQISPVISPPGVGANQTASAVELLREVPDAHPLVSTAARLSATFPYVSPAARSTESGASQVLEFHVVDGAYVDNEGVVTSVDWINRLLAHYERDDNLAQRPFDRVVLLRIQAFPKQLNQSSDRGISSASGWRTALLGPLDAMMSVRSTSQTERGDLEIGLLTQATRGATIAKRERYQADLKAMQAMIDALDDRQDGNAMRGDALAERELSAADLARQQAESRDRAASMEGLREAVEEKMREIEELEVVSVIFDFHSPDATVQIPMSWKLTERQKRNIDHAWQALLDGDHPHQPLQQLDRFFRRLPPERFSRRTPDP